MARKLLYILFSFLIITSFSSVSFAEEPHTSNEQHVHSEAPHDATHEGLHEEKHEKFNAGEVIMHHITDSHEWHFFSIGHTHVTLPLPCILYNTTHGLSVFLYSKFEHGQLTYHEYRLNEKHKIETLDGSKFFDISITKNVLQMMIGALILFLIMSSAARKYKNGIKSPSGMQNLIEVLVSFVRDEVVKPMLGKNTDKYLPYLLTIFFFIWINNLLGLLPGSANVTGNIAVTITLALFTFIITMFSSTKHYWHHMLTAPGVPMGVKPILILVEVLSIFTKPFALLIRLFANMTAGHLIVLSFLSLIFIFAEMSTIAGVGISIFSVAFATFIYALELLVAVLQAYIFVNLSSLFISEALAGGHDDHH